MKGTQKFGASAKGALCEKGAKDMDRILVAEDDESIREELKTLLRANG